MKTDLKLISRIVGIYNDFMLKRFIKHDLKKRCNVNDKRLIVLTNALFISSKVVTAEVTAEKLARDERNNTVIVNKVNRIINEHYNTENKELKSLINKLQRENKILKKNEKTTKLGLS